MVDKTEQLEAAHANIGIINNHCGRLQHLNSLLEEENRQIKHKLQLLTSELVNSQHSVGRLTHSVTTLNDSMGVMSSKIGQLELK